MTDINKAIREALNEINNGWDYVISDYCSSKEQEEQTEIDKQKELDDVVAKIKALVVESLPKEKQMEFVESKPTVTQNDEDRCRFYRYGGYDFAIREIRSIFSE